MNKALLSIAYYFEIFKKALKIFSKKNYLFNYKNYKNNVLKYIYVIEIIFDYYYLSLKK